MLSRRRFASGLFAAAVVGVGGARFAHGLTRKLRISHASISLPGAPTARIVHLSDLHLGVGTPRAVVVEALEAVRRAEPDLVALTGDYVNLTLAYRRRLERLAASLPSPCVATLGNHDHWAGADEVQAILEQEGIEVLRNAATVVSIGGGRRLRVVGVDDGFSEHADIPAALEGVDEVSGVMALTHYPLTAEALIEEGCRLVLAGHTHGVFSRAPRMTAVAARFRGGRYLHGLYPIGEGKLSVCAGIGSVVPGSRGGSQAAPEVSIINLNA